MTLQGRTASDYPRRETAKATDLVRRLAHQTLVLAIADGSDRQTLIEVAALLDGLGDDAEEAAREIGESVASARTAARDPAAGTGVANYHYWAAGQWTFTLNAIVGAAVKMYANSCLCVADRLAVAEEAALLPSSGDHARLTAKTLAQHARAVLASQGTHGNQRGPAEKPSSL
jgi:hypothetical protein